MATNNKVLSITFSSENSAYLNEIAQAIKIALAKRPTGDFEPKVDDAPDGGWPKLGGWYQAPDGWPQQGGWVLVPKEPHDTTIRYADPTPPLDKSFRDVFKALSKATQT
jgi:hypothetical protein